MELFVLICQALCMYYVNPHTNTIKYLLFLCPFHQHRFLRLREAEQLIPNRTQGSWTPVSLTWTFWLLFVKPGGLLEALHQLALLPSYELCHLSQGIQPLWTSVSLFLKWISVGTKKIRSIHVFVGLHWCIKCWPGSEVWSFMRISTDKVQKTQVLQLLQRAACYALLEELFAHLEALGRQLVFLQVLYTGKLLLLLIVTIEGPLPFCIALPGVLPSDPAALVSELSTHYTVFLCNPLGAYSLENPKGDSETFRQSDKVDASKAPGFYQLCSHPLPGAELAELNHTNLLIPRGSRGEGHPAEG